MLNDRFSSAIGLGTPQPRLSGKRRASHFFRYLDALEGRTLLSVNVTSLANLKAIYTESDGDVVTLTVSKGNLHDAGLAAGVNVLENNLQVLDLTNVEFSGANVTFAVKKGVNGDGLANVGYINATGNNLGKVTIPGDLGRIDVGAGSTANAAISLLSVRSVGRLGLVSQGNTGSLVSNITGRLTTLTVTRDIQGAFIGVSTSLGTATIGGSLIGGNASSDGEISVTGTITSLKIGGDLLGGPGADTGTVHAGGIGSLTVGGSLIGSAADDTGSIKVTGSLGTTKITGDVRGGAGQSSGFIYAGQMADLTIGGSMLGGAGRYSAQIYTYSAGKVKIGGSIVGGSGYGSGNLYVEGPLTSVTVGGSIIGGSGDATGVIFADGNLGTVSVKNDIRGGDGANSGEIAGDAKVNSIIIGGSLIGAAGTFSGEINFANELGKVSVTGDVRGGAGDNSGSISAGSTLHLGKVDGVAIGGSLLGGGGGNSGSIIAFDGGDITGAIKIGVDVQGGMGTGSGFISGHNISGVTVGGSLIGGDGGTSGMILSTADMGAVSLGGSIFGGSVSGTNSLDQTGAIISGGRLTSVSVTGSVVAGGNTGTGALTASGTIRAAKDIGSLTVKGSLLGNENATNNSFVVISAGGNNTGSATIDVAIGKIAIGGSVRFSSILGGYSTALLATNADAQIGAVTVGADWVASNLVAGASNPSPDPNFFGTGDVKIAGGIDALPTPVSKIASVTIKGLLLGTPDSTSTLDHFGFVAQSFGAIKANGAVLTPNVAISGLDDVAIDQIATP